MACKLNNQTFLLSPTEANLVAPFSSAQDLTRFQSASSLVQLFFATMKGFRPVNVKSRGWSGFPKEELTHPAEEVCARADLRLLAVVVVRHDHLEPLGRQLVAPLSCPGQDFWGLVVFLVFGTLNNLFVCLSPTFRHWIPQCCNSRSQCLVPLPLCRYWGLSQGRWPVSKFIWSGIFQLVFPFKPVPVARRQNYCTLEEMRTVLRTTRENPIMLRRFDLQCLTPVIV